MRKNVLAFTLLAATTAFSQHGSNRQLDAARQSELIGILKEKYTRWEKTETRHISVTPFWNDIAVIRVQYGLSKDPVPDPYVYYATAKNRIYPDLTPALRSMKYMPSSGSEAMNIAAMLVNSANRHALVIKNKEDIKSVPKKLVREHRVKPPEVSSADSSHYDIVLFSYKPPRQGGITRHEHLEQLKKHTIELHNGKVRFDSQELLSP